MKYIILSLIVLFLVGCGGQATALVPQESQPPVVVETVVVTVEVEKEVVISPTPESEAEPEAAVCPPAQQVGPWTPVGGKGTNFEVTCNEEICAGTHVQLWWPGGSGKEWGEKEISVLVPPGLSIEVKRGAGTAWVYAVECFAEEIEKQITADNERRAVDTAYFGRVSIDDLIASGLAEVRFDRR